MAARRLEAAGIPADEARNEARLLLLHALKIPPEELRLRPNEQVPPGEAAIVEGWVSRREAREPLAYILGTRSFYGREFTVTPAVLIPRPETEFVVESVLRHIAEKRIAAPRIADMGTGSGCIAVSLAAGLSPDARIAASDISPDALAVARANAERHHVAERITFGDGDFLAPIAHLAPFDVIASNPPYIGTGEIPGLAPEVRDFEPRSALGTCDDALYFYRRFAREAPALLVPGGLLTVEVGQGQAETVAKLWESASLTDIRITRDYAGIERVVSGVLTSLFP